MTTYGTIPTSSDNGLQRHHIVRSGFLSSHRPWREMAVVPTSPPRTISTALSRIKANVSYFYANYAIVVLCAVFLSLLWRPVSLIAFTSMMVAWLYLYFLRDEPLVIVGYAVDERAVLIVLSIFTTALLLATATANVMVALAVGAVAVLTHGVFSGGPEPEMDTERGGTGGPGLPSKVHLVETASSTFSTT